MDEKSSSKSVVPIGTAIEKDIALPITVAMRTYFSTYHLWAAKDFSEQAKLIEKGHSKKPIFDIKHRAYVINSILSSVAFAEAAINEVFQDASDQHHSYISSLDNRKITLLSDYWEMTELKNKSHIYMLDKYQLALRFCDKEIFNTGSNPFQDARYVISLRNSLVHYKPETISVNDSHKLSKQLQGKFSDNALMSGSGNPYFPDKCLGFECATWAWKTMEKLADNFFSRVEITPNYKRVNFSSGSN